jgi:hypothetical protein
MHGNEPLQISYAITICNSNIELIDTDNRCSNLRGQTLALKSLLNLSKPRVLVPKSATGAVKVTAVATLTGGTLPPFVPLEPPAEWAQPQFVWDKVILPPAGSTSQEGKRTTPARTGPSAGDDNRSPTRDGAGRGRGGGRGAAVASAGGMGGQAVAAGPSTTGGFKPRRTGGAGHPSSSPPSSSPSPSPSPPLPTASPSTVPIITSPVTPSPAPVAVAVKGDPVVELWAKLQAEAKQSVPPVPTAGDVSTTPPPPVDAGATAMLRGVLGIGGTNAGAPVAPAAPTAPSTVTMLSTYNQGAPTGAYYGAPQPTVAPLPQHLSYGVTGQTPNYHHLANLYGTGDATAATASAPTTGYVMSPPQHQQAPQSQQPVWPARPTGGAPPPS